MWQRSRLALRHPRLAARLAAPAPGARFQARGLAGFPHARAAVFHGPGKPFTLEQVPVPEDLTNGDILVELDLATICGSDLHTVSGTRGGDTPIILGHEGVGRVVKVGADTMSRPRTGAWTVGLGDRVSWTISDSCHACTECRVHRLPSKCENLRKYGHTKMDTSDGAPAFAALSGCYATHVVLTRGTTLTKLPPKEELPDEVVAPANCALATVVNCLDIQRMPRYGANASAVVQGAGMLGIYAVAWLKHHMHVEHVFVVDVNEKRLDLARRFGGVPLRIDGDNFAEREREIRRVCPRGVDIVVEMAGRPEVVEEGLKLLRNGGHYSFAGMVHPDSQLSTITGEQLIRKCLTIRGVHNYSPWHLDESIHFLRTFHGRLPFDELVGPVYPLSQINEAIEEAKKGQDCRIGIHFR